MRINSARSVPNYGACCLLLNCGMCIVLFCFQGHLLVMSDSVPQTTGGEAQVVGGDTSGIRQEIRK